MERKPIRYRGKSEKDGSSVYGYYARLLGKDIIIDEKEMLFTVIQGGSYREYVEFLDCYEGDLLAGDEKDEYGSILASWMGLVAYSTAKGRFAIIDDLGDWYELEDFVFERVVGEYSGTVDDFLKL